MDGVRTMRQKTREQRRKLMRKQKLYGLVFVLLSIFVVIMCMTGKRRKIEMQRRSFFSCLLDCT